MTTIRKKSKTRRWRIPRTVWVDRAVLAFFVLSLLFVALVHYIDGGRGLFFPVVYASSYLSLMLAGLIYGLYKGGVILAYLATVLFSRRRVSATIALTFATGLSLYGIFLAGFDIGDNVHEVYVRYDGGTAYRITQTEDLGLCTAYGICYKYTLYACDGAWDMVCNALATETTSVPSALAGFSVQPDGTYDIHFLDGDIGAPRDE